MKVTTPKFRVNFPAVFTARRNELNGQDEFGLVMLFDKDTDLSVLKAAAKEAADKKWGDKRPRNMRSPFRDGDVEREGKEGYENTIFVNTKSKMRPGVVDENLQTILDENEVYSGCYARATVSAYAYDRAGNAGVAFGLMNVQKLGDGEPLSSRVRAEDDFVAVGTTKTADTGDDF